MISKYGLELIFIDRLSCQQCVYIGAILLPYAQFSVFDAENRDAELSGGLGLLHTVHITVDSFYFWFGEVQFFNKGVGLCIIGGAVVKAISGVGDVVLVVVEFKLSVVGYLSAKMEEFFVHCAVASGLYRYVLSEFIFAVYIAYKHSFELI